MNDRDRNQPPEDQADVTAEPAARDGIEDAVAPAPRRKLKNQSSIDEIGRAFQDARERERDGRDS